MKDVLNEELAEAAAEAIRGICKQQGVTSEWVARRLGYDPTTFSNYLSGNRPVPASLVARITSLGTYGLVSAVCYQSDGTFIAHPAQKHFGEGAKAYKAALKFLATASKAEQVFFKVLEDERLTVDEFDQVKRWQAKVTEALIVLQKAFDEMPISADGGDDE